MQNNEWDLPPPPGVGSARGSRTLTWLVLALVVAVLALIAFFVPIPIFYQFVPGPVEDVGELVDIDDAETFSSEGKLFLTTASLDAQVTFADVVASMFSDESDVVFAESIAPDGDLRELERLSRADMERSKQNATHAALVELGFVPERCNDPVIAQIVPDSPADDAFEVGDVVRRVDGESVDGRADVIAAIRRHEPGEQVRFTIERGERAKEFSIKTIEAPAGPDFAFVGIGMEDTSVDADASFDVKIETGDIGGPSAGLMFALGVYDELTDADLTAGRSIAGTGTIDCEGAVGAIGEANLKVAGAEDAGAEIFLVPQDNFELANAAAQDIEVIPVNDLADALDYLEGLE